MKHFLLGVEAMTATARADMDETIAHEPNQDTGLDRPMGPTEMAKPMPPGQNRYTFSSGARPLDGYTIKRAVGRGGFGEVYYATSDSGKEVALKLILRNVEVERRGVVQCMNLKCPNLLSIFDLKSSDAGDTFVVMEYVAGPSLANVLARHPRGMPLPEVRAWLKGLVEGVAYLHDHGIVHRDLKPANLFMEEGIVKIGDYGLAKLIAPGHGTEHSESIGTCHYMAPEIASGKYHKPIDVYAIGIILYEMITGQVPFEGETVGEVLMKHLTARPDVSKLPEPYQTIVSRALAKDPNQRPARLHDLLPPEDAPQTPNVRFIGDAKVAPPVPPRDAKPEEEVLRIEAEANYMYLTDAGTLTTNTSGFPEEPVFYIGPETRPPRPPLNQRLRANLSSLRRQNRSQARRVAAPRPAPTPPPLPSGRIRVAELAGSLLWAALLTLLLALAAGAMVGIDLSAQPQRLAYLVAISLLGSWGILAANKAMEERSVDPTMKRLIYFALGVGVGAVGLVLADWTLLGLTPNSWPMGPHRPRVISVLAPLVDKPGMPLRSLLYFGLLFVASGGWEKQTARGRKARFRIWPIAVTGLLAALFDYVVPLWPYVEPYGIAVGTMIAVVTQLASPWSEDAAAYARASRRRRAA